jgi:hypothetical protein
VSVLPEDIVTPAGRNESTPPDPRDVSAANTRRVVLNDCFGGFGLSHAAVMKLAQRKGWTLYPHADDISVKYFGPLEGNEDGYGGIIHYYTVPPEQYHECSEKWRAEDGDYGRINSTDWYFSCRDLERDDPDLVAVVDDLGDAASGAHAELKLVEIPADVEWEISEYDGLEHIAEKHRTWRP